MASTSKVTIATIDDYIAFVASIDSYEAGRNELTTIIARLEKNGVAKGKTFADMLVEPTAAGTDPLDVLGPPNYGLGYLHILVQRANAQGADPNQMMSRIAAFVRECRAPELILNIGLDALVRYVVATAEQARNLRLAADIVLPLFAKYLSAIGASVLTPLHRTFAYLCLRTDNIAFACDTMRNLQITQVDYYAHITYHDNLLFHYYGGILFALHGEYALAIDYLETCICAPGSATAAVQVDAYKKLVLVQFLHNGKNVRLPKYVGQSVTQHFKSQGEPYTQLLEALQGVDLAKTASLVQKHIETYRQDSNLGLVEECVDRQRPQIVHKLTETYVALSLPEIASHLLISDPDSPAAQQQTEQLIFEMIRRHDIHAEITRENGEATVAFLSDPEPYNSTSTAGGIDFRMQMIAYMGNITKQRSRQIGGSKDFLQKALSMAGQASVGPGAYAGGLSPAVDEEPLGFGREDGAHLLDDAY